MILGRQMVAETEIICKQSLPAAAVLDVQYNVCAGKEQKFQIDFNFKNSSPSTPRFHEPRVSESVSNEISCIESILGCPETMKSADIIASPVRFVPNIHSGSYADIGPRISMDDEHIRIDDLSSHLGSHFKCPMPGAFYAVFDGHGGPEAALYIKENAMKLFFEDADMPQMSEVDDVFLAELENTRRKAFLLADLALADEHSVSSMCRTTALTALVLGRHLLVANAGDCRAVLCRKGDAVDVSRP